MKNEITVLRKQSENYHNIITDLINKLEGTEQSTTK